MVTQSQAVFGRLQAVTSVTALSKAGIGVTTLDSCKYCSYGVGPTFVKANRGPSCSEHIPIELTCLYILLRRVVTNQQTSSAEERIQPTTAIPVITVMRCILLDDIHGLVAQIKFSCQCCSL